MSGTGTARPWQQTVRTSGESGDPASWSRPLIGVAGALSREARGFRYPVVAAAQAVLSAVDSAGGDPVILTPGSVASTISQVRRLDGLLLPGGADIKSFLYGQVPHEHHYPAANPTQDEFELHLLRSALERDLPVLGICRGLQIINVHQGGTLEQHLGDIPSHVQHGGHRHTVSVSPGSLLESALAGYDAGEISSFHHQAIDVLGAGLKVSAWASDGVIEAVELEGHDVLGVQWHPEDLWEEDSGAAALFAWLVHQAGTRSARRIIRPSSSLVDVT